MSNSNFIPQKFVPGRNPLLELCPYCGEAAELFEEDNKAGIKVRCSNSECPFKPESRSDYETEERAIKAWNTRKGGM
jgi:hypothetical protein